MNTQPEATTEQLANSLEFDVFISVKILRQAAALLRTQHAEIERKDALLLLALEALETHPGNYKLTKAGCVATDYILNAIKQELSK